MLLRRIFYSLSFTTRRMQNMSDKTTNIPDPLPEEDITKKTLDPNKLTQNTSAISELSVQQLQDYGFYGKTTAKEALKLMEEDRKDLKDSKIFIEYCEKIKSDIVAKALEEGDDKQIY